MWADSLHYCYDLEVLILMSTDIRLPMWYLVDLNIFNKTGTLYFGRYCDARGDQCDACGKLINAVDLKSPRCKLCSQAPAIKTSKHLFIEMPGLQASLEAWMDSCSEKWTSNARVIAKSWVKGGLQPRCITRDLKWGTPVPLQGYESKVQ